jgi:hypothetical protein
MLIKKEKGQSTVEYIILVSAVIAVLIGFMITGGNGTFGQKMNETLGNGTDAMANMAGRLNAAFGN